MGEWVAEPGAEAELEQYRGHHEDVYLEACRGDDFFGVQAYSRTRVGKSGVLGPEKGVEVLPMGYEYWPSAAKAPSGTPPRSPASRSTSPRTASAPTTTSSASASSATR